MMDGSGNRHYFDKIGNAYIPKSNQDVWFAPQCTREILDALKDGGTIRFAITDMDNPLDKYVFSIEDATGFDVIYNEWIKQYGGYLQ